MATFEQGQLGLRIEFHDAMSSGQSTDSTANDGQSKWMFRVGQVALFV
jgi:hypothetical protein